ncbi:hypothetical protein PO909_016652 [Leuciscus waleckii]
MGYLAGMIQNGDLSLTASEPEAHTEVVREPSPELTQEGQTNAEPGVNYNLIDLWSADPIPTQVPTLTSSSSSPVPSESLLPVSLPVVLIPSTSLVKASPLEPSAPLVSCSSSALPPPLAPCASSYAPWAPLPPARLEAESPANTSGLQAHTTTSSCQPVALTSTHHSFIASGPSARKLRWARLTLQLAVQSAAPSPCTPGLLPSSDLPVGLPYHIVTLVIRPHVTTSVLQVSVSAPVFRVYGVAMVHQPLASTGSSHHGFASADQPQGFGRPLCLDSTLAPPPVCTTMVPVALFLFCFFTSVIITARGRAFPRGV